MRITIDDAGRVVIPKPIRDRLGLVGGTDIELEERDGVIEIQPAPTPMHLVDEDGVWVAVTDQDMPPLTDEVVRETLERVRDRR